MIRSLTVRILSYFLSVVIAFAPVFGYADVTYDGSYGGAPTETLTGDNINLEQGYGEQSGSNLFHSFSQFDVNTNQTVNFNADGTVENIFGRVTSNDLSEVYGRINSDASLWLLNPNGFLFGEGASINVQGNFYIGTSDFITFENGERFYADPSQTGSILSVANPLDFGFLDSGEWGDIEFDATQLGLGDSSIRIVADELKLINESNIISSAGGIDVFTKTGILLRDKSRLWSQGHDASTKGGKINVRTEGRLHLEENGWLLAQSYNGAAGDIEVDVDELYVRRGNFATSSFRNADSGDILITANSIDAENMWLLSDAGGDIEGQAKAGNLVVDVRGGNINLVDSSWETAAKGSGTGAAGTLTVYAGDMLLDGKTKIRSRAISSSEFAGDGGPIEINATNLELRNESLIRTESESTGDAGDVEINLTGNLTLESSSAIISEVRGDGTTGNSGNVVINAADLDSTNSVLALYSWSPADTGNLTVNLTGDLTASDSKVEIFSRNAGGSGDITINAENMSFREKSEVKTRAQEQAVVGNINLNAESSINVDDSLVFTNSSGETGSAAGNIVLTANSLNLNNNSNMYVDNYGEGSSGFLDITTNVMRVDSSVVSTNSYNTQKAGDITIQSNDYFGVSNGGVVRSQATQSGTGGDISISSTDIQFNNGRIENKAYREGNGGSVELSSVVVGMREGSVFTVDNEGSGNPGEITINATGATQLSGGSQILASARGSGRGGELTIVGGDLFIADSSVLSTSAHNTGNAGDITIDVEEVVINKGSILSQASSSNTGVGGEIDLDANSLLMIGDVEKSAEIDVSAGSIADGGNIDIDVDVNSGTVNIGPYAGLSAVSHNGNGNAGNISVLANAVEMDGSWIRSSTTGDGLGGNVEIVSSSLTATSDGEITASTSGNGDAGTINLDVADVELNNGSRISANAIAAGSSLGSGNAGIIGIAANNLSLLSGSHIEGGTETLGDAGALGINVRNQLRISGEQSRISMSSSSQGSAGALLIDAVNLLIEDQGKMDASVSGSGDGQDFNLNVSNQVQVRTGGEITVASTDSGDAGDLTITGNGDWEFDGGRLLATTSGTGAGGNINLAANTLVLQNTSELSSATTGLGAAGDINLDITSDVLLDSSVLNSSTTGPIFAPSTAVGGDVNLQSGGEVRIRNGSIINAATSSGKDGGGINLTADNGLISLEQSSVITTTENGGGAGDISINANRVEVSGNLFSNAEDNGVGGQVQILADNSILITDGIISASASDSADGGAIQLDGQQVSMSNGQLDVSASGAGTAGEISVAANLFTMENGSKLEGSVSDSAAGKTIQILVDNARIDNSEIASNNSGSGEAGNILIGSNIAPNGSLFSVVNNAKVTATNSGTGSGGEINIGVATLETASQGEISVNASSGIGGDIIIGGNRLDNDGVISSDAENGASGGTITIANNTYSSDGGVLSSNATNSDGGSITLTSTSAINLSNAATIQAQADGSTGKGGTIALSSNEIRLSSNSLIAADTSVVGSPNGDGGTIRITDSDLLSIEDSTISVNTFGDGKAGSINIGEAGNPVLQVNVEGGSIDTLVNSRGAGGQINIFSNNFSLVGGGRISTSVDPISGSGNGGTLTINNTSEFLISGADSEILADTNGNEMAGGLILNTDSLLVGGGTISATNKGSGTGEAISLTAREIAVTNGGAIRTNSDGAGDGRQLIIAAEDLLVVSGVNSELSVESSGAGNAGAMSIATDLMRVEQSASVSASISGSGNGFVNENDPAIDISANRVEIRELGKIKSDVEASASGGSAGDIHLSLAGTEPDHGLFIEGAEGESFQSIDFTGISSDNNSNNSGSFGGTILVSGGTSTGVEYAQVRNIELSGGRISAKNTGIGSGGNIELYGDNVTLSDGGALLGIVEQGAGGNLFVDAAAMGLNGGLINSDALNSGTGGNIHLDITNSLELNGGEISAKASGMAHAGQILVEAESLRVDQPGGRIAGSVTDDAQGGIIELRLNDKVELVNDGAILVEAEGNSDAAGLLVRARDINLDGGRISGSVSDNARGATISVVTTGGNIVLDGADSGGGITTDTYGSGEAGSVVVDLNGGDLTLQNGAQITAASLLDTQANSQATGGSSGDIFIRNTNNLAVGNNSQLSVSTETQGSGGTIEANAQFIELNGGSIRSNSSGEGDGGNIALNADSPAGISISGANSGIYSDAENVGRGGSIVLNTSQLSLSSGASISATTSYKGSIQGNQARAGVININNNGAELRSLTLAGDGTRIEVSSAGSGVAGQLNAVADTILIENRAEIAATIAGEGNGFGSEQTSTPAIRLTADRLELNTEGKIRGDIKRGAQGSGGEIRLDIRGTEADSGLFIVGDANEVGDASRYTGISTDNSGLNNRGGRVLISTGQGLDNSKTPNANWGRVERIELSNGRLSAENSGGGVGGSILLAANELNIGDGGELSVNSTAGTGGDISIAVDTLNVSSGSIKSDAADSQGGRLNLTVNGASQLTANGRISAEGRGTATAGDINLTTSSLDIEDAIISGVLYDAAMGGSIDIDVTSGGLNIQSLSGVSGINSNTLGSGDAGQITIEVAGNEGVQVTGIGSGILTNAEGLGNGGSIEIAASQLLLSQGANVSAATQYQGEVSEGQAGAGTIRVTGLGGQSAERVVLDGQGTLMSVASNGSGTSGQLFVDSKLVEVTNGAEISASIGGTGNGFKNSSSNNVDPSIHIQANRVRLSDGGKIRGDILTGAAGSGGDIQINIVGTDAGDGLFIEEGRDLSVINDYTGISTDNAGDNNNGGTFTVSNGSLDVLQSNRAALIQIDGGRISAENSGSGIGGSLDLNTNELVLLNGATISATSTAGGGGNIQINAGGVSLDHSQISSDAVNSVGGTIELSADNKVLLSSGSVISALAEGNQGSAGSISIAAGDILLSDSQVLGQVSGAAVGGTVSLSVNKGDLVLDGSVNESVISTTTFGSGDAGDISIDLDSKNLSLLGNAEISASSNQPLPAADTGSQETDTLLQASAISTSGSGGNIRILNGDTVTLNEGTVIEATTETDGKGGTIDIHAKVIDLQNARIQSNALDAGEGGSILLAAAEAITISGSEAGIFAESQGAGFAGSILVQETPVLTLSDQASIAANTYGSGRGGNITIGLTDDLTLSENSSIAANSFAAGRGGVIDIDVADVINLSNASISSTASGMEESASAGSIRLAAADILVDNAEITSDVSGAASGGTIELFADRSVSLVNSSSITAQTEGSGNAGSILIANRQLFEVVDPQAMESFTGPSVDINQGGFISTRTTAKGNAGDIILGEEGRALESLTLSGADSYITSNSGTESQLAENPTVELGDAGSISILAKNISLTDQAEISSASLGAGTAGSIGAHAYNELSVTDSYIRTTAEQSTGGDITLSSDDSIRIFGSVVSASAQGDFSNGSRTLEDGSQVPVDGGNLTIDSKYLLVEESDLTAEANAGSGGNITITTRDLLIVDTESTLSATSEQGVDGTVLLESPNKNDSADITELKVPYLDVSQLLTEKCSVTNDGERSSFVVSPQNKMNSAPQVFRSTSLKDLLADLDSEPGEKDWLLVGSFGDDPTLCRLN